MLESVTLTFLLIVLIIIATQTIIVGRKRSRRDDTEVWVEEQLNRLLSKDGYIIFGDLIIPSVSKTIPSTQIDHVIISSYGIFCLETKSHQGNIYGGYKTRYWKQYLGNKTYDLYNPMRQNNHHVESLEYLLRSRLKSPIHSYVVFPSARHVKVGDREVDLTLHHTVDRILNHKRIIYTNDDIEAIAKGLAYVSSKSPDFREDHVKAVREYISTKEGPEESF